MARDHYGEARAYGFARGFGLILAGTCFFVFILWVGPQWHVWQQGLAGEAALRRAEHDRKILVLEAVAIDDAADLRAAAEVKRAVGVAQANEIIGESLKGNEAYLRYLWIDGLQDGDCEIAYIPTEAGLPILEATRLPQ